MQSRVLQVFDAQVISLTSFTSIRRDEDVSMRVCADIGARDGLRLRALLLRLSNVRSVEFQARLETARESGGVDGKVEKQAIGSGSASIGVPQD